jgi:hypothetical protein
LLGDLLLEVSDGGPTADARSGDQTRAVGAAAAAIGAANHAAKTGTKLVVVVVNHVFQAISLISYIT